MESLAPTTGTLRPSAQLGFTAIELMVVVAIVAILAALAAPSFNPLIERWRIRQSVDGLQSALYYARSEAIKRAGNVTIRKEASGANGCPLAPGTSDWDCGWFVFVDTNDNGTLNAGEEVLQRFATPPNVQVTRSGGGAAIRFDRWGRANAPFGFSLVPLDKSTSNPASRGLCMSSGGRIRVTTDPADIPCNG
jgi:type IV fimbrial biogenesis protein FimT